MAGLILFAVMFGCALAHVSDVRREAVLQVAGGIAETMQRLVVWILGLFGFGISGWRSKVLLNLLLTLFCGGSLTWVLGTAQLMLVMLPSWT